MKTMILITTLFAGAANAQACMPHTALVDALSRNYAETRQAVALTGQGQMLEIFASDGGSWSIVITEPAGRACIVSAGQSFEIVEEEIEGEEG